MQHSYFDYATGSEADLMDFWRNRMGDHQNCRSPQFRGQGIATKLLKEVIADADREGVTLVLEVQAEGGLSNEELASWYSRYGFVQQGDDNFYKRIPRGRKE